MMDIDQYYYKMQPDQLYIIPPFAMHGATVPPGADYERAFLYINSDTLKMCGCAQIDLDAYFQAKVSNGHHQFPLTPEESRKCRDMLLRLRENQREEEPLSRFRDYCLLLPILEIICESMRRAGPPPRTDAGSSAIHDILMYINENYMNPITTEDVARAVSFSPNYLSRRFRVAAGVGLHEYIVFVRLHHAAHELVTTSDSITVIALRCGFSNSNYFKDSFKKKYGVTPRSYRNMR